MTASWTLLPRSSSFHSSTLFSQLNAQQEEIFGDDAARLFPSRVQSPFFVGPPIGAINSISIARDRPLFFTPPGFSLPFSASFFLVKSFARKAPLRRCSPSLESSEVDALTFSSRFFFSDMNDEVSTFSHPSEQRGHVNLGLELFLE